MCEELLAEMVTEKFAGLKENRDLYKIWVDAKHRACFGMTLEESKSGSLQDISGKKIHRYGDYTATIHGARWYVPKQNLYTELQLK